MGAEEPEDGCMEAGTQLWLAVQEDIHHMSQLSYTELQQVLTFSEKNLNYQRTGFDHLQEEARRLEAAIASNEMVLETAAEGDFVLIKPLQDVVTGLRKKLDETRSHIVREKNKLEPLAKLNLLIKTEMASRPLHNRE